MIRKLKHNYKKRKKHQKKENKEKKNIKQKRCFLQIKKKLESEMFAFWVVTFEQNVIPTCSKLQNDR